MYFSKMLACSKNLHVFRSEAKPVNQVDHPFKYGNDCTKNKLDIAIIMYLLYIPRPLSRSENAGIFFPHQNFEDYRLYFAYIPGSPK